MARFIRAWWARVALVVLTAGLLTACRASPGTSSVEVRGQDNVRSGSPARLLQLLGARRLVVMAGDDVLHAGLGTLSRAGLRPLHTHPALLLSNVAGNGHGIVIGGSPVPRSGFAPDGAYRLGGTHLVELAPPGSGLIGPALSGQGLVAAIHPEGGFSTLAHGHHWRADPRETHVQLSPLTFDSTGDGFALARANTPRARLVKLARRGGVRDLTPAPCGSYPLAAPTGSVIAVVPARRSGSGQCAHPHAVVVDVSTGRVVASPPPGWDPVTWSADGRLVLLARGHRIEVWQVSTGSVETEVTLSTHVWMAAAQYAS